MTEDKKGEFKDFTDGSSDAKKEYKNKVVFLHKSKKGSHLFAFANEGNFHNCKSIIMNISDVEALIAGKVENVKVSIMPHDEPLLELKGEDK